MARHGIMLCKPYNGDAIIKKWRPPYIVQPKLNGLRSKSIIDEYIKEQVLLSSEANIFSSVPHINQAIEDQNISLPLDGELYQHGRSMSGPDGLLAIVKRKNSLHPDYKQIEYHVFDLVVPGYQSTRIKTLKGLKLRPPLITVPTYTAYSLEDISRIYYLIIELGYEGIVVRNVDANYIPKHVSTMMKLKPHKKDDYEIIGYKEEISKDGVPKGRLGAIICKSIENEIFSVGSGLDDGQREEYWKNPNDLIGKICTVKYQELTHRGVPWLLSVADIYT